MKTATVLILGTILAARSAASGIPLYPPEVLGERAITYDATGVRPVSAAPAPGVHPRVYFNAEDLPAIRNRLATTAVGQEAMKMIRLYTDFLRNGRSVAWDSKPNSFKLMPDGTPRIGNAGLYDRSLVYNQLVAGTTTKLAEMIAANDGTGLYTLAGEMSLEAFECLVDEGQPGVATRAANLAAALDTWCTHVLSLPALGPQHNIGGHLTALTYDMAFPALSPDQRTRARAALARLMASYAATPYTGVGCAPQAVATNWVAINSFTLLTACALEGELTLAEHGISSETLAQWFTGAMHSHHKFLTYGWFASGSGLEGQGKNYLFGAHMIPYARRGHDFFQHPHARAYGRSWMPAVTQPYGYSFTAYDLLGGSGSNPEKGRYFLNSLDYSGLKWRYPDDAAVDFAWRNFILTEYKDAGGVWRTFPDLREAKFTIRSVYANQLLPAAIFASDIASTDSWQTHNAIARPDLDYLDREGGTLVSRSGHEADAAALLFHVRQDFGGHTFADRNTFTFSALGRQFINYNSGSTNSGLQAATFHSIVEVDGLSMFVTDKEGDKMRIPAKLAAWSPAGGSATFATGDATYAYSQEWFWNAYTTGSPVLRAGFVPDPHSHNTFRRAGNRIPEAFGDTPFVSFPHWVNPGQLEGIQAKPYNPMYQVHRTIGLVRGVKPYALVIDDVRKDDSPRNYKWLASIAEDLVPVPAAELPPGADPATDVVLREPASTGDRRLLVRILRALGTPVLSTAPTAVGSPLAYTEMVTSPNTTEDWKRLVIERAAVVAPEFRVLLFPFRQGEPLPVSTFTGQQLVVSLAGQTDTFDFAPRTATIAGQAVTLSEFTLSRNGTTLLDYRNQIEPAAVRGPADPAPAAIAAPTASATPLSETQVLLAWSASAPPDAAWLVERSPAGRENWTPLAAALPATASSFTDAAAAPSTSYDYRIRHVSPAGMSDYGRASSTTPAGIGDGIPGSWRLLHFGNGLAVIPGTSGLHDDPDGDGQDNEAEFAADTVPVDPASSFRITAIQRAGHQLTLSFPTVAGKSYRIEAGDTLAAWPDLVQSGIAGTGGTVSVTVTDPAPRRFFRAVVEP